MNNVRKGNLKFILQGITGMLICTITLLSSANYSYAHVFRTLTVQTDTTPPVRYRIDSLADVDTDTIIHQIHTSDTFNVKVSKDSLDAPVNYTAKDSMVLEVPSKQIILYNSSTTKYKDIDLSAYKIQLDQAKQVVVATYTPDSAGSFVGKPSFKQAENNMDADSITFNFKTQKGITTSTYTTQGEIYVFGDRMKKIGQSDYFALRGRLTTCNLDQPHFAFVANKMKVINKKLAISGPIHPEFEGVPIPIYLPFGFFPLSQGRHSGFLAPEFTVNQQFGIGLERGGYYKVLSDNFDVITRADIYSYGGYRLNITPSYRVRYRYQGSLNFAYQNTRFLSDLGKQEFDHNKSFNITWSHTVDSKARPGTSFSANVNAGSTQFNRYVANNPMLNYQNQLSSSISYSKNWNNKYNLTVSANHNQNNNTRLVNLSLPNATFTATTLYPFQRKEFIGEAKWYEKLGIGLNSTLGGQSSFYDSLFSVKKIIDTFQWGAQHNIPITLSLPALGPIQVAPGISYSERWFGRKFYREYNGKTVDTVMHGFYTARDVSFSLGLNTALYGIFEGFGKNSSIKAIRHVMRPTVSLAYKPDLSKGAYYQTKADSVGITHRYSVYDGSLYGGFGEGRFGGINWGIDNNLEMKVRNKNDTSGTGDKKVRLLDGFGINGSYNLITDSFRLSTFSTYLRSTLFEKVNITASAVFDPYETGAYGVRRNRLVWQDGKASLGRLTNGNIAMSTSFRSKEKKGTQKQQAEQGNDSQIPMTMEEQQSQLNYIRNNPAEFADFNIPWSVNVSYSLSFSKVFDLAKKGFRTDINSNLSLNGDFNLTEKWKTGMNTYYDFKTLKIQTFTMFLSRDMHCWQMSINVTPVGLYRSFNITINPKSSLLRDIRVNRNRSFYGGT